MTDEELVALLSQSLQTPNEEETPMQSALKMGGWVSAPTMYKKILEAVPELSRYAEDRKLIAQSIKSIDPLAKQFMGEFNVGPQDWTEGRSLGLTARPVIDPQNIQWIDETNKNLKQWKEYSGATGETIPREVSTRGLVAKTLTGGESFVGIDPDMIRKTTRPVDFVSELADTITHEGTHVKEGHFIPLHSMHLQDREDFVSQLASWFTETGGDETKLRQYLPEANVTLKEHLDKLAKDFYTVATDPRNQPTHSIPRTQAFTEGRTRKDLIGIARGKKEAPESTKKSILRHVQKAARLVTKAATKGKF